MRSTFQRIQYITADLFIRDPDSITLQSRFKEDLGSDSIDQSELVLLFDEEFEIEISDQDAAEMKTLQDAVNIIDRLKALPK